LFLIITKIKFRYIKSKLKDSTKNIEILEKKIQYVIKKYNDLKLKNLEMKNKINLLSRENDKFFIDLNNSKSDYDSLKIAKFLDTDNKKFVKKRIEKMIKDLDFCIINLSS